MTTITTWEEPEVAEPEATAVAKVTAAMEDNLVEGTELKSQW